MRKILGSISVLALGAFVAHAGAGCSSSSSNDAPPDQSCEFAQNENNCWRQLTKTIDDCLTDEPEGDPSTYLPTPPTVKGTLSSDLTSCTYASGRAVTFGKDPRVNMTTDGSKTTVPDRDVTVTMNGKTCLRYVTSNNMQTVSVTGPGGTFTIDQTAYTCPDGSRLTVNPLTLFQKCAGAVAGFGGLPNLPGERGATGYNATTGEVQLWLLGMGKDAYDCAPPTK